MKISILKIFKWIAKFTVKLVGYKILSDLIHRYIFKYKTLHYKIENGYYLEYIHIKKGHKVYPIEYKESDRDMESWERDLKCYGFIKKIILAKGNENIIKIYKKERPRLRLRGWIEESD